MEGQTTILVLAGAVLLIAAASLLFGFILWQRQQFRLAREAHYRNLFEHAGMIELVVAEDSVRIQEANRAATSFFHRSAETLRQLDPTELLGMERGILAQHAALARQVGSSSFHIRYRVSGTELELEIKVFHVGDGGNLLLVISDVTEQFRSLQSLRENEAKLRAILEASADGIVMTDEFGIIQLVNPAAEMMFGWLREEITGHHLRRLMPAGFSAGQDAGLGGWVAEGTPPGPGVVREFAGVRKDGEEIPIRVSLSRVSLEDRLHYVAMVQDLGELRRNERQLTFLAQRDVLTGLLNRREFERRLDAILSFSDQPETEYALCYMDVDQFKLVNDTCGHAAGDELLKQLAILVKSGLRQAETIARLGGDEFGALLTDCTVERAEAICNGLLQTVRHFLFTWSDKSFNVSISLGLAGFRPHAESASRILSQADVACHMAKRLGRDRIHVYHHGDHDLIRHHGDMHLVSDINQALDEGRFHLFAQPIVPVSGPHGCATHYEILVRMVDEGGQLVNPDDFIPAAERYILMPAIDRWVIGHLFSLQADNLKRWNECTRDQDQGFLFGINLSGTSITDDGFLSYLKRQFAEFDIPYRSICFEITETAAVANLDKARTLISELRAQGCSFALDDFGTGLSSYSYLKELPVDYLKIDGSFVRNMTEDPVDYAMVDSINQIAHILGLHTIAEWAENPGTLLQLRALNVDYAQGFGVGKMVSVEEFRLPDAATPPGADLEPRPLHH